MRTIPFHLWFVVANKSNIKREIGTNILHRPQVYFPSENELEVKFRKLSSTQK